MDSSSRQDDNLPEVAPDTSPEALSQAELYRKYGFDGGEGKYPHVSNSEGDKYAPLSHPGGNATELPSQAYQDDGGQALGSRREQNICGFRRKAFWIFICVAILVAIVIAVGAGVGATSGSRDRSNDSGTREQDAGSSQASSMTTVAASLSTPITDSASPTSPSASSTFEQIASATSSASQSTPTFLNNQTAPVGFAFQGFSDRNYGGKAGPAIREEGFIDLGFDANSYVWLRNGTACCLTFCQGSTADVGYWCDDRRQTAASAAFDRVYIWCDQNHETEINRCF